MVRALDRRQASRRAFAALICWACSALAGCTTPPALRAVSASEAKPTEAPTLAPYPAATSAFLGPYDEQRRAWEVRTKAGLLACSGFVQRGYPVGRWRYWDDRGALVMQGSFDDWGRPIGAWLLLENGRMSTRAHRFECRGGVISESYAGGAYFQARRFTRADFQRIGHPTQFGDWCGAGWYEAGSYVRPLDARESEQLFDEAASAHL